MSATIAGVAALWALSAGVAATEASANDPAVRVHLSDLLERAAVERAVRGAASRLDRAECRAVLDDFATEARVPLRTVLAASGRSPAQYLIERVSFVDGGSEPQCRDTDATVAFTSVGDDLVRLCAAKFERRFKRQKTDGELLIIHEFLHALGLGEDPPSSAAISRQVQRRCAR